MDGGDEVVEGEAPEGEDGEVGERFADGVAAAEVIVRACPADNEEAGGEDVDALATAVSTCAVPTEAKTEVQPGGGVRHGATHDEGAAGK